MNTENRAMRLLLACSALVLVLLGVAHSVPVSSGPAVTQHRVQAGNGKGNTIKAILDKRVQEHLYNRLMQKFPLREGVGKPPKPVSKGVPKPDSSSGSTVQDGLQDYYDMFWLGNVTIGTPEQGPFSINFDTGSADLWVVDSTCGTGVSSRTLKQCVNGGNMFNATTSSSYSTSDGRRFRIRYGDGSYAIGYQGIDTVKIMDVGGNNLAIPTQTFAQAIDTDRWTMASPMMGIFGLGFQSNSVNGVVPPFINAVQQGLMAQPIFTVYMETESNETAIDAAPAGGVYTFGGLDSTNCGDVAGWADLTSASFWQFAYDNITVGSKTIVPTGYGGDVISDTGTSLILGDADIVMAIGKAVKAKYYDDYNVFIVACDATYKPVTFSINGTAYNLTPTVLNVDIGIGNNLCLWGMIPVGGMSYFWGLDFVLGDPFIRQYCNVHDVVGQQIGFAPALALQSS